MAKFDVFWKKFIASLPIYLCVLAEIENLTVNDVLSHISRLLTLIIFKTYLQTGEMLPHQSTPSCRGHFSHKHEANSGMSDCQ